MTALARPARANRSGFVRFVPVATRWADNDVFGHVNNVQYYAFFDTAVCQSLIEAGLLDIQKSTVIGLVVETTCTYFESLKFPDALEVGMAMERVGSSSLTYRLGVFCKGAEFASAQGYFTHVYVDKASQRPVSLPEDVRSYGNGLILG